MVYLTPPGHFVKQKPSISEVCTLRSNVGLKQTLPKFISNNLLEITFCVIANYLEYFLKLQTYFKQIRKIMVKRNDNLFLQKIQHSFGSCRRWWLENVTNCHDI